MLDILLADDHELVRTGLRLVLQTMPGWRVCGEAADGAAAIALAARHRPTAAIIDLDMPVLCGIEAIREIRRVSPETAILALTGHDSPELAERARVAGARGIVLKTEQASAVVAAVHALGAAAARAADPAPALVGETAAGAPVDAGPPAEARILTQRELEITRLLAEGKSNWAVARILGISPKTVETHRANIMRKLELASVVELVHFAVRNRLVAL